MTYRPTPKTGHKGETCACVRCRLSRGEVPNPNNPLKKSSKARKYLNINDALDDAITTQAIRRNVSKAQIVREAIVFWLNEKGTIEDA